MTLKLILLVPDMVIPGELFKDVSPLATIIKADLYIQ